MPQLFKLGGTRYRLSLRINNLFDTPWWELNPRNRGTGLSAAAFPLAGRSFTLNIAAQL